MKFIFVVLYLCIYYTTAMNDIHNQCKELVAMDKAIASKLEFHFKTNANKLVKDLKIFTALLWDLRNNMLEGDLNLIKAAREFLGKKPKFLLQSIDDGKLKIKYGWCEKDLIYFHYTYDDARYLWESCKQLYSEMSIHIV